MSIKKFARIACVTTIAGIAACTAAFSACSIKTDHPRVEMTIQFNGVDYDLEFQLYRNMYPRTVQHFIELADAEFYDGTIIHNYTSRDWYGGGYDFTDAATYEQAYGETGGMENYLIENSKEREYFEDMFNGGNGFLTSSVYKTYTEVNGKYRGAEAISTLIGEFANNDHEIAKGALTSQEGALRMYYTPISTTEKVWVETLQDDEAFERDYEYNSATSLFAIQVGTSSDLATKDYCIFGVLNSDGDKETLNELEDAIADFISENYTDDSTDFTQSVSIEVGEYEEVLENRGTDVTYSCTAEPIVIKTVKVTKY